MQIYRTVLLLLVMVAHSSNAFALEHPPKGSLLRQAILDAVRPEVETQIVPGVEFRVTYIGVENGWAFVQAEPHRKGGGKLNPKDYFPNDWLHMDGLTVTAVLRLLDNRWTVMESHIGSTDAWYCSSTPVAVVAPCGVRERLRDERIRKREERIRKYSQLCEDTKYYTREERINKISFLAAFNYITESEMVEAARTCEELYPEPKITDD